MKKNSELKIILIWLWKKILEQPGGVIVAVLANFVSAILSTLVIVEIGSFIDQVNSPKINLWFPSITVITLGISSSIFAGISYYLMSRVWFKILAQLREEVVASVLDKDIKSIESIGAGDILSRISADISLVTNSVNLIIPIVINALTVGSVSFIAIGTLNWRLGLASLICLPFYFLALKWYLPKALPQYSKEREVIGQVSTKTLEILNGREIIYAYERENYSDKVYVEAEKAQKISISVFTLFTRFTGRINRAECIGLITILITGFIGLKTNTIPIGKTIAAALLFHKIFTPIGMLLYTADETQNAGVSLNRLVKLLESRTEDNNSEVQIEKNNESGVIFENISFGYSDEHKVIDGLNFRIPKNTSCALVGSSGAGKTTLAGILFGRNMISDGEIYVDGYKKEHHPEDGNPKHIAMITQDNHIFSGSILDNLRLVNFDLSIEDAKKALFDLDAIKWVENLPDGINTMVGEENYQITSAQAGHLALVRIWILNPEIIILDEATAEFGSSDGDLLDKATLKIMQNRTSLIIAHRLNQAKLADNIIVMDKGKIVELGDHDYLIKSNGLYAGMWSNWEKV